MYNFAGTSCGVFFFQAEDGIRDRTVTGVQTCALPIYVHGGVAEERARRPRTATPVREHVEQQIDRRSPLLGICRVGGDALGPQREPQRARAAGGELVLGGLAVDQPLALAGARMRVRGARAGAPHLLVHDEQQADLAHADGAQPLRRRDLGRDDALRIARAPPLQETGLLPRRQMGRHSVEVGGQHHAGRAVGRGQDVRPARRGLEHLHLVAEVREVPRHEARGLSLLTRHRRDVHEPMRQRDRVSQHAAPPVATSAATGTGSRSKNAACSCCTASRTRSSSITNVKLTRDAPWEISDTLMSWMVLKMRAATPGVVRSPSPTTHTIARSGSTLTSPRDLSSLTIAGSARACSRVSETLTSDVVTTSTSVRCRSNTSNSARRNPYAPSIRLDTTCRTVTPTECAMALTAPGRTSGSASARVPGSCGARELQMRTGMPRSVAG